MFTSWQRNTVQYSIIATLFYTTCMQATPNTPSLSTRFSQLYTYAKNNADTIAIPMLFLCGSAAVLEKINNQACAANTQDCQMAPILFIVYSATGALTAIKALNK